MGKYFLMQLKRTGRLLPRVLCVLLVLLAALAVVRSALLAMEDDKAENKKLQIGMCGTLDDPMLELGVTVLQSVDDSRYSLEMVELTEPEARAALGRGEISAYVVMPKGFVEAALEGELYPIRCVTTAGAGGLVALFKDEVTRVVEEMVVSCEKGVYGLGDLMRANELSGVQKKMNGISIEYVYLALAREDAYEVEELGIEAGADLSDYLTGGFATLLLLLAPLPFAPVLIREDLSLGRVLASQGKTPVRQALCDFLALLLGLWALLLTAALTALVASHWTGWSVWDIGWLFLGAAGVLTLSASLSFLLFELARELISGVLLQFFTVAALGFVSGCMYPLFMFPEAVQKLAPRLPAGAARLFMTGCLTDEPSWGALLTLGAFSALFTAAGCLLRAAKLQRVRG